MAYMKTNKINTASSDQVFKVINYLIIYDEVWLDTNYLYVSFDWYLENSGSGV